MRFFHRLPLMLASLLLAVIGCCALVSQAFADTSGQAITVSPAVTQLSVDPGGSTNGKLDVVNSGTIPYSVTVSVSPYHVDGIDYDPQFTQLPGTVDPSKWVTLSATNASAAPHTVLSVTYTLTVPPKTAPGGYYAVIFAETSPATSGSGVIAHNRVGNILYITVKGSVKMGGSVTASHVAPLAIQTALPLSMTVSNSGGLHFLSTAQFTIKNTLTNKTLFHASYDRYILPQTKRLIATSWTPLAPIGIYTISQSATVVGTVHSLPSQTIVYVQPWFFVLLCVIVAALIGFCIRWAVQRAHQRE